MEKFNGERKKEERKRGEKKNRQPTSQMVTFLGISVPKTDDKEGAGVRRAELHL